MTGCTVEPFGCFGGPSALHVEQASLVRLMNWRLLRVFVQHIGSWEAHVCGGKVRNSSCKGYPFFYAALFLFFVRWPSFPLCPPLAAAPLVPWRLLMTRWQLVGACKHQTAAVFVPIKRACLLRYTARPAKDHAACTRGSGASACQPVALGAAPPPQSAMHAACTPHASVMYAPRELKRPPACLVSYSVLLAASQLSPLAL